MAALSFVLALYLRLGDDMLRLGAAADRALWRRVHADRRRRVPGDRALPRHLALRLAAGPVQHRPRGDADRADLSAGHVPVHPARHAAALDPADRLAGADRAARRAAARLSPVQGPRPRPPLRARPRRQRAGAADQHQGRRRHLHPRDACATRMRSTGSSACCPTRRRGSAGRSTACRCSARSMRSKRSSPISTGAAGGRKSWSSRRRAWPAPRCAGCSTAPTRWRSRWRGCRGSPNSSRRGPSPPRFVEPIALEDLLGRPQAVLDRDGDGAADPRPPRSRHRRRRDDRLGAGPADRGLRAGAADPARQQRIPALRDRRRTARALPGAGDPSRCSAMCATGAGSRR